MRPRVTSAIAVVAGVGTVGVVGSAIVGAVALLSPGESLGCLMLLFYVVLAFLGGTLTGILLPQRRRHAAIQSALYTPLVWYVPVLLLWSGDLVLPCVVFLPGWAGTYAGLTIWNREASGGREHIPMNGR